MQLVIIIISLLILVVLCLFSLGIAMMLPFFIDLLISHFLLRTHFDILIIIGLAFAVVGLIKLGIVALELWDIWDNNRDFIKREKDRKYEKRKNIEEKFKEMQILEKEINENRERIIEYRKKKEQNKKNINNLEYELACEFFGVSQDTEFNEIEDIYNKLIKIYNKNITKVTEIKKMEINNYFEIIKKEKIK